MNKDDADVGSPSVADSLDFDNQRKGNNNKDSKKMLGIKSQYKGNN